MSRRPSASNLNQTRPLNLNRPPSRPSTPSNGPRGLPEGPARPQRSELRNRTSELDDNSYSASARDTAATNRSDQSTSYRHQQRPSTGRATPPATQRPRQQQRGVGLSGDEQTSPVLSHVMSAFQAAGQRKRAMTNGSTEYDYPTSRQAEIEEENVRQQRIRARVPGRRAAGKPRAGDIDAILDQIKDEWEFVIDPDFNNVELALQLLDASSMGKDINSFRQTKYMLSEALRGSVDKHYQALAASLPHHGSLINHLTATQSQIADTRTALQEAKDFLGNKRADLVQLWSRGQTLEEMMRILDQIEHLKTIPDVLETLMSEKRLLSASILLVRSLKMINKQDMLEIGAVADLRSYLQGQETALRDILVDELHSHLYLKSFWCDSRWAAYTSGQQTFPKVDFEELAALPQKDEPSTPTSPTFAVTTRLSRFIHDLSLQSSDPPYDLDGTTFRNSVSGLTTSTPQSLQNNNPESNSFSYMETLLESLAVLGKLGGALDSVTQRLPAEIFALVNSTVDEVEERSEYTRRTSVLGTPQLASIAAGGISEGVFILTDPASGISSASVASRGGLLDPSLLRLAALESSAKRGEYETLRDFFWTVYSKLDAVCQGLRVVYEVSNRIGSRREFKDSSGAKPGALFPIAEVWMTVQAEVRMLLNDYLTDEEQSSVSRNPISSINEILRESKFVRNKSKHVFKFSDTDVKLSTKTLRIHEDELLRVLRETMPGLVQGSTENNVQAALSSVGSDDRMLGVGQHHRLLIKPDAFHVSILFLPTLSFVQRVAEILPAGTNTFNTGGDILNDFVSNVYLPQLEEKVSLLFHQAVTGSDAFQPDPTSTRLYYQPVVKSSIQLLALVNSLCAMLQTTPFHRDSYARLILSVIIQFYQRCSDRFQDLVSNRNTGKMDGYSKGHVAMAAQWAQKTELNPCLSELLTAIDASEAEKIQLCRQETHLELDFLGQDPISENDIISSIRTLSSLACLYTSVSWFTAQLSLLKTDADDLPSAVTEPPLSTFASRFPSIPVPSDQLKMPLSREMSLRFQALLKTYEQLAEMILVTIRIDIRCRIMFYLDSAMRFGNYFIEHDVGEPDSSIIDLNTELRDCNDVLTTYLPPHEQQFTFTGLGHLMEQLLITNARYLRVVNKNGIKKLMRNMLALQQSVKVTAFGTQSTDFDRAKIYYSMYSMSPEDMLDVIRQKQEYSFEEYRTMLHLQCGIDESKGEAGLAEATNRSFSMYMIDLHSIID